MPLGTRRLNDVNALRLALALRMLAPHMARGPWLIGSSEFSEAQLADLDELVAIGELSEEDVLAYLIDVAKK